MEPYAVTFLPTAEACQNFESYLDEDELAFYSKLDGVDNLSIHVSVNPFNALLIMMGKI
jgi:hypothetical protein